MIPDARVLAQSKKFSGAMAKRWRSLKGDINQRVIEEDSLGLKAPQPGDPVTDGGFDFRGRAEKEQQFQNWIERRMRQDVLEPVGDKQLRQGGHYSAKFLRASYEGGLRDSGTRLRQAGGETDYPRSELQAVFNLPIHQEQVRMLYRRAFSELNGITSKVSQEISRELSDGLLAGENPRKIAQRMNDRIDAVGLTRSKALARTELSRSYNMASERRYKSNGIDKVAVLNTSPCEVCASVISGNPYKTGEIPEGNPPYHPNCQCALTIPDGYFT